MATAEMTMERAAPSRVPVGASLMALSAGVVWSFGALCSRLADGIDAWQYLTWRSIGVLVVVQLIAIRRGERSPVIRAFGSGWVMFVGCLCLGASSVAYVYAVKNTSAVNAALLSSTAPLAAAVVARSALGEHLDRATIWAIVVATVGLVVMVNGGSGSGQARTLAGDIAAVVSALAFGGYATCVRSSASTDWSPIMPGYATMVIVGCGAITVSQGDTLVPPIAESGYALFHGAVLIVAGTLLYNHASKRIAAGAMATFAQTENVFVPLWIFVGLGDRPTVWAVVGGLIVLLAVFGKSWADARPSRHRQLRAAGPPAS